MTDKLPSGFGFVSCLVLAAAASAQTPEVLLDINQTPIAALDSMPDNFVRLGGKVLFAARTPAIGRELWQMDVATGAVSLVVDLLPGTASSWPSELVAFGGQVWFVADSDGGGGVDLWRTDGTAAGTVPMAGALGGGWSNVGGLTVVGNRLFFAAYTAFGNELVVTDGSAAGTLVLDIHPGGDAFPGAPAAVGNELWFRATTAANGMEAWRSDGTLAGTTMVADLVSGTGGSFPSSFVAVGSKVLFLANGALWGSDGTAAGTTMLNGSATRLTTASGLGWFASGGAIWSTDGTPANTQQRFTVTVPPFGTLDTLVGFGSHLAVGVFGGIFGTTSSWISDGTQAGTFASPAHVGASVVDGNQLWFAGAGASGSELWRTDGTPAGTVQVADAVPGPGSLLPSSLFVVAPGDVLFAGGAPGLGRELWRSNGTAAGTVLVANLADETSSTLGSSADRLVDAAGIAYFIAYDGTTQTLWRTDGTAAGTHVVVPAGPDQPIYLDRLTAVGDQLYCRAYTAAFGHEILVSDGTAAGTHVIETYPGGDSNPSSLVAAADRLYFLSYNPWGGRSLWQTNGTTTVAITGQIAVGTIGAMAPFGRGLVFGYNHPPSGTGEEPWYTDGTVAGTVMLGDLHPGISASEPSYIVTLNDRCFFTARTTLGYEKKLFVTDGTPAGTFEFFAGHPGAPSYVERLIVVREQLFFAASDPVHGHELWVSDGTVAGTHLVLDAAPGTAGVTPTGMKAFGDLLLYYVSASGLTGAWRSDGTAAGTFRLTDQGGFDFLAVGERLAFFQGWDEPSGYELWATDGTIAGTGRFADLLPGERSSMPSDFTLSRGRLLFIAEDEQLGREVWALDLDATNQSVGYGCATNGRPSRLWCDDPVLGGTTTFAVRGGPPVGLSVPLFTNHVDGHRPLGLPGCDLFLDVGSLVMDVQVFQGGAAAHQLAVPASPALDGLLFRVQVLTLSGSGDLELGLSNAVTLALGI